MALPWIRLDSNIAGNHKVLMLVGDKNYRALCAYMFGLAYSGQHGTDGYIPKTALAFIHATQKDAESLVNVALWHPTSGGWQINDWREYQPTNDETDRRGQRARWLNCRRWHAAECDCSPPPPARNPSMEWRPR